MRTLVVGFDFDVVVSVACERIGEPRGLIVSDLQREAGSRAEMCRRIDDQAQQNFVADFSADERDTRIVLHFARENVSTRFKTTSWLARSGPRSWKISCGSGPANLKMPMLSCGKRLQSASRLRLPCNKRRKWK